jgi:hypothetical protein
MMATKMTPDPFFFVLVVSVWLAVPVLTRPIAAQRLSNEFRQALESLVRPLRTHAVVLRPGVPTAAIDNRDPVSGNVIVAVTKDELKTVPILGRLPQLEEFLVPGEVLQLVRLTYTDNVIDLRMVSLDPHKSIRGFSKLVVTTFRVAVPVNNDKIADVDKVEAVLRTLQPVTRLFSDEHEARKFATTMSR